MVVPFQRRVIEMPLAVGGSRRLRSLQWNGRRPGLIVGIRMASAQDKRIFKLIGARGYRGHPAVRPGGESVAAAGGFHRARSDVPGLDRA